MNAPPWGTYGLPQPPDGDFAFEVDDAGQWWLFRNGIRRRNSWKPKDPWDVLVAFDLMHLLNDNGRKAPIEGEFLKVAKRVQIPIEELQWGLRKQSAHLWIHKLIR
ncbi:hypothetical protein [Nonomuraea angiospora]|uniref:hypothetical protein n=1 Tax=Nonomuraea angiospora TaxID=46172 RepID=UPI0029BA3CD7|nr:hypothetical protein [Nonomuraea angiospora]MDX3099690.1 hypothetical protein [Nonomuraea angiospora]